MNTTDWLLIGLLLCTAAAHLYFGIRYWEFFVVNRSNMHQSYWHMIREFQRHHAKPAKMLISVIWLQMFLVGAFFLSRLLN
jgi:hypothetical protein